MKAMTISKQSIDILLDLVEIKLGFMHVNDRDDARELLRLRHCRHELLTVLRDQQASITNAKEDVSGTVLQFPGKKSRRSKDILKKNKPSEKK